MATKMWLDDVRDPKYETGYEGWVWVKTYEEAVELLRTENVVEASLDHDLGGVYGYGAEKSGYDVVCWMEENGVWPEDGVRVHSYNPVGAAKMIKVVRRAYAGVPNE